MMRLLRGGQDVGETLHRTGLPVADRAPWQRSLLLAALVALGYAAGSLVAWEILHAGAAPVFYAPAGVTSAALLSTQRRHWPWILAAAAAVEVSLDLAHGVTGAAAIGFAVANTLEPWVGASLVRRWVPDIDLASPRHVLSLLAYAVLVGPLVGAAVGATTDAGRLDGAWVASWGTFWAGDALGVLTVGTTILAWVALGREGRQRVLGQLPTVVALGAAAAAATLVGFTWSRGPFVVPTAVLLVAATRGIAPLATSATAFAVTANVLSTGRAGPWKDVAVSDHRAWVSLQLFIAVTLLGAGALTVGLAQRDRARVARDAEAAARRQVEGLRDVASRLSTAATVVEIAQVVADHGLSQVADMASVGILSPDGTQVRTVPSGGLPVDVAQEHAIVPVNAPRPLCAALRTGAPVVTQTSAETLAGFPDAAETYRRLGVEGVLAVPILVEGMAAGALGFVFREPHAVTPAMTRLAQDLAQETAQAMARARRYEAQQRVAHELQRALLPEVDLAPAPGVSVSVHYRPADPQHEVGGDWYDVFALPGGRVAIAVGDVVGHDLLAATTMGKLQPLLRVLTHEAGDPADALTRLDRASRHVDRATMATVGLAIYDLTSGMLSYSCAGHPPPLLLTAEGAELLERARGLPLGVDATVPREVAEVRVPDPAQIVWYTDGLVERRGESLAVGLDRLETCARGQEPGQDPDDLADTVLARLTEGRPLDDDLVVVCVRVATG